VRGNKGVQLVFNNGKLLLIGSQRAEELEEAIRSIMEGD
jgi:TATA-box binding protein (TBP) (component of TFIID and TFIIIB)